jgi:hypothetical protein
VVSTDEFFATGAVLSTTESEYVATLLSEVPS